MNIAIFDLQHFEMVHVLHRIFNATENNVTFFINKNVLNKIKNSTLRNEPYLTVIEDDYDKRDEFFIACNKHMVERKIDAIIFNTIDLYYDKVWEFIKPMTAKVFVTIHNSNTWLNPPFTLNKLALKNYYYRKKILTRARGIIVQEELFVENVKQNKLYNKVVLTIPYTLNETDISPKKNHKLIVAVPGAIDGHRRDYNFTLDIIEKTSLQNPNIKFVFIGEVVGHLGEKIYSRILELKKNGCDIEHFFDKNSNKVFDTNMEICDVVFMPLNVETKYEGINETYGKTKATGVMYDLNRFQKPGIAPAQLVIPQPMKTSILSYTSEQELIVLLHKLERDRVLLKEYTENARKNSCHYTIDKIKSRFLNKFYESVR